MIVGGRAIGKRSLRFGEGCWNNLGSGGLVGKGRQGTNHLAATEKSQKVRREIINETEQGRISFENCTRSLYFMPSSYLY